jgi:hypothetical protein
MRLAAAASKSGTAENAKIIKRLEYTVFSTGGAIVLSTDQSP